MLSSFLSNPMDALMSLLIALPGVLLALSAHEAAHGYVAYKCGDPTAKLMGRVTLNPLKHLDPVGFLCMLFAGFGWARPVPVNPNNFRNYRRDDLKVSLAGIVTNLILCFLGFCVLMGMFSFALSRVPVYESYDDFMFQQMKNGNLKADLSFNRDVYAVFEDEKTFLVSVGGARVYDDLDALYDIANGMWAYNVEGVTLGIEELLFNEHLGFIGKTFYQMVLMFVYLNLALAVFNLIPLPPLDGYHVLNDLVLKRPLFADYKAQRIGNGILIGLILIGNVSPQLDILNKVQMFMRSTVFNGLSSLWYEITALLNMI